MESIALTASEALSREGRQLFGVSVWIVPLARSGKSQTGRLLARGRRSERRSLNKAIPDRGTDTRYLCQT
jgi:hypothetical protein